MSPEQKARLEEIIQKGFPLFSSQCMQMGFQIYRRRFRDFALFALIIPFLGSVFTLVGMSWIGTIILTVIVSPILNAGFYLAANSTVQNEEWSFSRFFEALPQAAPLILNNTLALIISALILTPMYFLLERIGFLEWYTEVVANPVAPPEPPGMSGAQSTAFFLNLIPLIYLQVGFSWAFPLILFVGANPLNALEYSRRLINRAWGAQFWLLFTFFSMFMLASFLLQPVMLASAGLGNILSFGLFLIFPWAYCSLYIGFHLAMKPREE
ncbi:MAG: hypothetical protein AAFP77_03035 [Bacteroidota bacterium]